MVEDNSHAGQGAVMLDIGGNIGALIVTMPAEMEGLEIEIRPIDGPAAEPQVAVHAQDEHTHAQDEHTHAQDEHTHAQDEHTHAPDEHDHAHGHLIHVAVVARPGRDGLHYSAVYSELVEGTYELYVRPAGPVQLTASVAGGAVTEAEWPH